MPQMSVPANHASNSMKEVLLQLQSADAAVRGSAEELLNKSPLQQLLPALASAAASPENEATSRQLAAVLLRRYVHNKMKEAAFNKEEQQVLVQQVLQYIMGALATGGPTIVRKAAAEAIGELWRHLPVRESISQTAPFGVVVQWLEMQQPQDQEDDALLWLLVDRLADIAGPEVHISRAQQLVHKLQLTLQQRNVESTAAAEEALATLFGRTIRWKPENSGEDAQREKKAAIAAYSSTCAPLLQLVMTQPRPELLAPLLSIAEKGPQFFRDQHVVLLESVRGVLTSPHHSAVEDTRRMALQLAATAFLGAPKFARKHMPLVKELLLLLANVAAESPSEDDEAAWERQAREDETPEETIRSVALELIVDLASALCDSNDTTEQGATPGHGGPEVLEILMNITSQLMEQKEPRYSFAALELLCLLLEDDTCRPLLGNSVGMLTSACITAAQSPYARLRWGGLRCLGLILQRDEPWSAGLQQQHGEQLLSLLSQESAGDQSIRCRRQAMLALAAFISGIAPEVGEDPSPATLAFVCKLCEECLGCANSDYPPYGGRSYQRIVVSTRVERRKHCVDVPSAVIAGCSSDDLQTQEFALALASALAKACGTSFAPYYPPFVAALQHLLGSDDSAGQQKIRQLLQEHPGRCLLEAAAGFAGDLGSAVGTEVFKADAPWLVDRLYRLLVACEEVPAASAVCASAMVCMGVAAPACGLELLQQMQPLMELILKKAKTSISLDVEEELGPAGGSRNVGAEMSEEGGVSQIRVQDKTGKQTIISINTAAVEERVAALKVLGVLALAIGTAAPTALASAWTEAALESCSSEFSIMRKAAFEALPSCLAALETAPEQRGQATIATLEIVASFLSSSQGQLSPAQASLAAEHILPAVAQILAAQAKLEREGMLLEACKMRNPKKTELLEKVFEGMGKLLLPVLTREFEKLASKEVEDDEWEDLSDDEEDEENASCCYDSVMQCTGGFFKVYGADCVPHFDAHLQMPYGALLAHEHASFYGKVAALCIFADAINFGGQAAKKYSNVFLPAALLAVCPPGESASDEDQLLAVSAAAYGLGVVAQRDQETFSTRLQPAVEALERCLANPVLRTESGRAVADCAACALLKVLSAFGPQQDINRASAMLAKLLENWFPLVEDEQEILDAHDLILQMVIHANPLCSNGAVQQQLRRLVGEVFPAKPELVGERARRENLLQAAKDKLC